MSFKEIYDYYRYLDPAIDIETNQVRLADPTSKVQVKQPNVAEKIQRVYINNTTPGEDIVNNPELQNIATQHTPTAPGLFFNTVNQKKESSSSTYLNNAYWKSIESVGTSRGAQKPPTFAPPNFYSSVCNVQSSQAGGESTPPIDLTINLLRSPLLSYARNNVDEITFFLNHMPSPFAHNLVPYFDVEFQMEISDDATSPDRKFLNKPSLLRFLLGSVNTQQLALTAADKSLTNSILTPTKRSDKRESKFIGMEMFTTPQTLTNMDSLTANGDRLNDAKPFLPPATLISGKIGAANAGAATYISTSATLEFVIHDKNRVVEFSEFVRGPVGTNSVTTWITFGWLAPRGNEHDEYAKFINQNMLQRLAFQVQNHSFSFNASGQVTVTLQLVSKMMNSLTTNTLDNVPAGTNDGSEIDAQIDELKRLIQNVKDDKHLFGEQTEEMKDIKIYQIINGAASGNTDINIPRDKINQQLDSYAGKIQSGNFADKDKMIKVIDNIKSIYEAQDAVRVQTIKYIDERLRSVYTQDSYDPFLPTSQKPGYFSTSLIKEIENTKIDYKNFDSEAAAALKDYTEKKQNVKIPIITAATLGLTKSVISFGKLFSVFCVPSLLKSCKDENIDELQINFYQFNGSCGPLSYHNIAEFPIDVRIFLSQFQSFIEKRGGDAMSVIEFLGFVSKSQFTDKRSRAYGMQDQYQPHSLKSPELARSKEFDEKYQQWMATYGQFVEPAVTMYGEVKYVSETDTKVDLLNSISSRVGGYYYDNSSIRKEKRIKKIHVYDRKHSPYDKKMRLFFDKKNDPGTFTIIPEAEIAPMAKSFTSNPTPQEINDAAGTLVGNARTVKTGKNVLQDYMSNTVPTIIHGAEGTMVKEVTLSTQMDGTIGMIYLQGGSRNVKSGLSENGLEMQVNNLPVILTPANLTMQTMGCPIASLYQQYYLDMGTGTTIDNLYSATKIEHSFSPGSFKTSWNFSYVNGYGKFYSAGSLDDIGKMLHQASIPPLTPNQSKLLNKVR